MFPKKILLLFMILASSSLNAKAKSEFKQIKISKTFSVLIPEKFNPQINLMPSFSGFWIECSFGKNKFSIWISRKNPETFATIPTVNRFWKENLNTAFAIGEKSEDKGCDEIGKHLFVCKRKLKSKKMNFVSEKTIWNANKDIVLIRVMTKKTQNETNEILNEIQFDLKKEVK